MGNIKIVAVSGACMGVDLKDYTEPRKSGAFDFRIIEKKKGRSGKHKKRKNWESPWP